MYTVLFVFGGIVCFFFPRLVWLFLRNTVFFVRLNFAGLFGFCCLGFRTYFGLVLGVGLRSVINFFLFLLVDLFVIGLVNIITGSKIIKKIFAALIAGGRGWRTFCP